jgi:hypothetical protein
MWHAITSPLGIVIAIGIVALPTVAVVLVVVGLRTESGNSRKARKADALRKIEDVNRAGYLDDVGTIMIDRDKQPRRPHDDRR